MTSFRTVLLCALTLAGTALADNVPFSRGALIIPMNSTFQSKAGQVSAYGLVYRILQANGPGHRNASSPVTIYIVNDPTKASPNRCIPTNTAVLTAGISNRLPTDTQYGKWTDGCDLTIANTSEQPVVNVPYGGSFPASGSTFGPTSSNPLATFNDAAAFPTFDPLTTASLTSPAFTTIRYGGAPFVIDANDAAKVYDLINSGDTGGSAFPAIVTSQFKTACTAAAASTLTDAVTTSGGLTYSSGCHYVNIHQATVGFNAQVERRLNSPPTPFALFDPDYGKNSLYTYDGTRANPVSSHIVLERYLKISGLWLSGSSGHDSQGCAIGNVSACTLNGSSGAVDGTPATAAQAKHGSIFDRVTAWDINFTDGTYPNGILNQKSGGNLYYRLFWAPHWQTNNVARGDDTNALNYIASFIAGGGNILGECASIASWENGRATVGAKNFLFTAGIEYPYMGDIYNKTNSNTSVGYAMGVNRRNCTDPGQTAPCVDYLAPGNIFSQVGDWMFDTQSGAVESVRPAPLSARRSFNQRMLVYRNDATLTDDFDVFNMGQESASKGVIVYVGGHEVSGDPLGSRIVLNSMLNLGGVPISSERALAGPTIVYGSANAPSYVDQVVTPTYDAMSGYGSNAAIRNFTFDSAANLKLWTWPYYPGHFRAHAMTALTAGEQSFNSGLIFDSAALSTPTGIKPSPPGRNLFTWLGGYPRAVTTMVGGANAPNNVLQGDWKPEAIDGTKFDLSGTCPMSVTDCVDVMGYDNLVSGSAYDGLESGLHLVVGSDGLCDVQQMLNISRINGGNDWGSSSNCMPSNIKKFMDDTPGAAWLLQRVRGYCYNGANTDLTPGDSDCVDSNDNRAHLGGLIHSSAAVMDPSPNIIDQTAPRPTVAFVAGYDGQLHAFYMGGGSGYTGPAVASFNDDNKPSAKFATDYAAAFAAGAGLPSKGTELWSFLPASQLPWLESNGAQVDSSPVVMDVFADFRGTGVREWHSVLLLSLGRQSTELLAIDVTNPLLPRLLWDNTGSLYKSGVTPRYSPNILMTDVAGVLPGAAVAPKYRMVRDTGVPSKFKETLVGYRKVYDFRDLGGTTGLSSSQVRIGLEPGYVVFAVSNMPPGQQGIVVYAIEASTGQMLWEWERPYDETTVPSDNTVPVVATVIPGADGAAQLLVGDHEGRIWELDAATGRNLNTSTTITGCTTTVPCQFAAFETTSTAANPQPITTNIAVARIPAGLAAGTSLKNYENERVILFGTSGADWITTPSTVAGRMHVALYDAARRVPVTTGAGKELDGTTDWTLSSALSAGDAHGVLQEVPNFPKVFANGERVYGTITVAGSVAFFATAYDKVSDVMAVPATVLGSTYRLNLGTATSGSLTSQYSGTRASYGGVAVYMNKSTGAFQGVVSSQTGSMDYRPASSLTAAEVTAASRNAQLKVGNNQALTYRLMSWLRRQLAP